MVCSPASELAFSQTREDPEIELQVIERLAAKTHRPLRVLLIASGGCTALSLLVHPAIGAIEAVDVNPAQLHLVELRRQALLHLSLAAQLQLIGADFSVSEAERLQLYQQLRSHLPTSSQTFWDNRQPEIAFGVNRVGRFEQLFRELAKAFHRLGLDPLAAPESAINHPQWSKTFERVFERQKLAKTFGEAAVNYSMDRSFGEHFADVFAQALQRFHPQQNYFLSQVWRDTYSERPLYLQADAQAIIRQNCARLHLHLGVFSEKLLQLAESEKFDLIQFSNISDWMPLADLHVMLALGVQCLHPGGALLGRRLNGDHFLAEVMAEHLSVDEVLCDRLLKLDRSFFYREVVVGFCL
ncbi:MAG: BtaA family protein [Desertifilum sp.]|nr:BtaA family protein [Desertifilum sp.]